MYIYIHELTFSFQLIIPPEEYEFRFEIVLSVNAVPPHEYHPSLVMLHLSSRVLQSDAPIVIK